MKHPVSHHPAIETLNNGEINKENLKRIHLEYRHAIVQTFTDALLMAQYQTKQLEPRLHAGAKMFPRCLLSLNIFDEFGFLLGLTKTVIIKVTQNMHIILYLKMSLMILE